MYRNDYEARLINYLFFINFFYFQFFFHNSHDKFDRQIIVSNQINQIESWIKHRCCAWVQKIFCLHWGLNSRLRACLSVPKIWAECDTTELFRCPKSIDSYQVNWKQGWVIIKARDRSELNQTCLTEATNAKWTVKH